VRTVSNSDAATQQPPAWAVWVGTSDDNEVVAVSAPDEETAQQDALDESNNYDEVYHVDGPFKNSDPGVWEFTFRTEHVEHVVVEAPNEDYAEETAEAERTHRGQYKRTVHTDVRRLGGEDSE